jgi:hypothetical protein
VCVSNLEQRCSSARKINVGDLAVVFVGVGQKYTLWCIKIAGKAIETG